MSYKQIIRYYLDGHKVNRLHIGTIENILDSCSTDDEVYLRISKLEDKVWLDNCKLRGFNNFEPNRELEFVLYNIKKELDDIKNRKSF